MPPASVSSSGALDAPEVYHDADGVPGRPSPGVPFSSENSAMESCGKTPADADFTTAMVDTMYKITVDGLTGTMKWDADREPDKAAKAMVFNEDGTTSLFAE